MPTMKRLVILLAVMWAVAVAHAQSSPVFIADYDADWNGRGPAGVVAGIAVGKPGYADGKSGRALKSGPGTGYVEYPVAGILSPGGGTVEMWVQPLDWKPADEEFHVFFEVRGEGALYLYKYYQGVRLLMLTCDDTAGPYTASSFSIGDWQPGKWHHIAGVWSADGVMAYVDGKPAGNAPARGPLPLSLGKTFRIGDHPWHLPRTSSSLIDEVRIYDRPLSPLHIAAHARGDVDFSFPLRRDAATLHQDVDASRRTVQVRLSTGGADVEDDRLTARLAIVSPGQPLPPTASAQPFANGQVVASLPWIADKAGEYETVAAVQLDGKPAFELRHRWRIPSMEWRGNRLGLEDRVLPPWTPLQVRDETVCCWGRDYSFAGQALPIQIRSRDAELLSRPIQLNAVVSGKRISLQTASASVVNRSDTRALITGELQGAGDLRFTSRCTIEYDGLLLIELARPAGPQPQRLSLDIPLRSDRALYRHRWAPRWEGYSGNLPTGQGVVDADKFIPYVWLGDNDRGLFWFCESDQQWPAGESTDAIQVVRQDQEVVLRLNLLEEGQSLPEDWRWTFCLQATPVKPVPKDWRKWRLAPGRQATVQIIWPTPEPDSLRHYGYPEATNPEVFSQRVATLHHQQVKVVPYLCLSFLSTAAPEWPFFRQQWAMGAETTPSDVARYGAPFAMVSPVGKEYADFIVWKTSRFIDRFGVDGLYHDNTHPYASARLESGCGYERDGKRRRTYPILGYRNLYRRMYAVMKSRPGESFTMAHMSGKVTIPILAYDDSYLDGEHFRGRVKDSYLDVVSLDAFRAEFMGRQWGVMPFFIPEFDAEHARQVEPTRGMMALLMVHDVSPWPIWCNVEVVNQAFAALDKFGYVDAEFIPYFAPSPPAATAMKEVYISAYQRDDGRTLLMIANLSREQRSGAVTVDLRRLGLRLPRAVDWPGGQRLSLNGNRLDVAVPGLGYRLIVLEPT